MSPLPCLAPSAAPGSRPWLALRALALVLALWPAAASAEAPLLYRRVLVPQEELNGQIRGLIPLARDEFERRLKALEKPGDEVGPAAVRIEAATFKARAIRGQLVDGTATLQIVHHAGATAALPLSPCSIAIESARWQGEPDHPATLGVDPSGRLVCLVERSGTLLLHWSQRSRLPTAESWSFDLQFPPAPRCRLEVATAASDELNSTAGLLSDAEPIAGQSELAQWSIELGGVSQTALTIGPRQAATDERPLALVRETSTYSVFAGAIDLDATLTLDVLRQSLKSLEIDVDPGLQVTAIRVGETPLEWATFSQQPGGGARLAVQLPAALAGLNRQLQITSTGQWPTGSRWPLPRVRVVDAVFQEGRATVSAPPWLRLEVHPLAGCTLAGVNLAAAARAQDQFQLRLSGPGTAAQITADPRAALLRELSGTDIRIDTTQVSGVLIAELSSLGGERFDVEALLPRQWLIDSVETQPADILAGRSLAPRGPRQQALRLNLSRPLSESRSLRLVVRAHYRRPAPGQPLPDDFFRIAVFPEARESRRLVTARAVDPAVLLTLEGDRQLGRLTAGQLSAAESRLFESTPGSLLFAASDQTPAIQAVLTSASPRYRADCLVQAHAERGRLRETLSIRCQTEASAVGSLLVSIWPRPAGIVTWSLSGEEARETAPVQPTDETPGGDAATYRLTLARPRSGAFELRGEFAPADDTVGVAWLPEASSQTGLVEVYESSGRPLDIQTEEVEAVPAGNPDRFTPLRARFRYEAGRRAQIRIVEPPASQSQPGAWIENLIMTSRYSATGTAEHELVLHVVNAGQKELHLDLPAHVANLRAIGEGDLAAPALSRGVAGRVAIDLAAGERLSTLRLRYATNPAPLGYWPWGSCRAPVPQFNVPVLAGEWQVALAPGLQAWGEASPTATISTDEAEAWPSWLRPLQGRRWLLPKPAWSESPRADAEAAWTGWTTRSLALPATSEAQIDIYRLAVIQVWAACLGISAGIFAFAAARRTRHVLVAAGLLGAAALVMVPPVGTLLAGAALGLGGGCLAAMLRPMRLAGSLAVRHGPGSTIVLAGAHAGGLLLVAIGLCQAPCLWAAPAAAARIWRVVIPIDEQQQPVGEYVYLEEEFYAALHKPLSGPAAQPEWLLEHSHYDLPMAPRTLADRPAIDELLVHFDIETFRPSATVALPLRREQVSLLEGRARLSGKGVSLAWSPDGSALTFSAETPGRYRLELALAAGLRNEAEGLRLDLAIPAAARSVVALAAGSPAELLSPAGAETNGDASRRHIPLAASGRLQIRWPAAAPSSGRAGGGEVEQLVWWRIRSGSVVAEAHFQLHPSGGPIRELLLAVDPRLRLAPGSLASPLARVSAVEGSANFVRLDLAEPATTAVSLKLSWLWPDAGGTGQLLLPTIVPQSAAVRRSWIAVSVEPAWTAELATQPAGASPAPTTADFLRAWSDPAAAPTLVGVQPVPSRGGPPEPLLLRVQPRPELPQAEQSIDWSLSARAAAVTISLKLSGVPPARWAQRLSLPPQLKVLSVVLQQNGHTAPVRWTQQADGLLAINLLEAPVSQQLLTVAAELPLSPQRPRVPLPSMRLEQATLGSTTLRIYRREDTQVSLADPAGWTQQDDPQLGQFVRGLGRLAAVLHSGGAIGDTQPRVSRAANEPRVSGAVFLRTQEDDGDWWAEAQLDLTVAGGVLDALRLAVPAEWAGPFDIDPAIEHEVVDVPGEAWRQLVIRPRQAASGRLRLTIRGQLAASPAGMQAPAVSVLDAAEIQRLVLLDTRSGADRIQWQTTGLASAAGETDVPDSWRAAGGEILRALAPQFSATARIRPTAAPTPRVTLADISARLGGDGTAPPTDAIVTSTLTIEPRGAARLAFTLPPGWQLIQTLQNGTLAQAMPAGLRTWSLAAPSTKLPYRLTIVTAASLPPRLPVGRIELAAPTTPRVPTLNTVWSIAGRPAGATALVSRPAGCSSQAANLMRLEAAADDLREVASAGGAELPDDILAESFVAAWRHYQAVLVRLGDPSPPAAPEFARRRHAAEQMAAAARQRALAARTIDTSDLANSGSASVAETIAPDTLYFAATGAADELVLAPPRPAANWTRQHSAGLLVATSLALLLALQYRRLQDWLAEHAALALAAAGIAWWLLAPWGLAGWLAVLAAAWIAFRWPGPRSAYDPASATGRASHLS